VDLVVVEMLHLLPVEVEQMEPQILVVEAAEHQQMAQIIQHLLEVPVVPVSSSSLILHKYK
jgi:nitrate reductase NapAB chaperone NapD